jgi:hypothetical protein
MTKIYALALLLIFSVTGCISSTLDNYSHIDALCQRYYDVHKRWPTLVNDLIEYDRNNTVNKTDWSGITEFSIEKISENQIKITYTKRRWYGNDSVSFSVYRPIVTIRTKVN